MRQQIFLPLGHASFAKIVLVLQLEAALAGCPDGSAHGRQRTDYAMQKLAEKRLRRSILLAEGHNFADERLNLLLSLLDQSWVERLLGTHFFSTHNATGMSQCTDEVRSGSSVNGPTIMVSAVSGQTLFVARPSVKRTSSDGHGLQLPRPESGGPMAGRNSLSPRGRLRRSGHVGIVK